MAPKLLNRGEFHPYSRCGECLTEIASSPLALSFRVWVGLDGIECGQNFQECNKYSSRVLPLYPASSSPFLPVPQIEEEVLVLVPETI